MDTTGVETTTCAVVGCGPAGAMLGLLLARSGVDVVVLEKYADFFRDFRGDTIHPSTLQVLGELGLLAAFERVPQQKTTSVRVITDAGTATLGDFTALPGRFRYISMVPQWDFLTFLTAEAARYPRFRLRREAEAVEVVEEDGVVRGVRYRTADGVREVRALLTVACDGRHSAVRRAAGLRAVEYGAPMDALWYRIPKEDSDPSGTFGRLAPGRLFPMIDRRTYWQGAYVMPKGSFPELKARGIGALHAELRRYLPFLGDRVETITGWDDVGFLEVRVNRLERWYRDGLLCLGDAAHAMSPIGGVGINLAIQDAVAAANLLTEPLRAGRVTPRQLAAVQRRRERPTALTQRLQLLMQRRMISPILESRGSAGTPLALRLVIRVPLLRWVLSRLLTRFLAIGFRPEHVRTSPVHNGLVGTPPAMGAL
ncbi:MAG TPA: FAD-dependent oxidoreductase [Mycobacteriales bacterium]|jgi:2-polyprenyl-6-methoxyphenol hydroxylase-like FAD-dependent oxidoreductase|nr:FAD-dependent oxidoreductase [Mycobacteriales bacterium]